MEPKPTRATPNFAPDADREAPHADEQDDLLALPAGASRTRGLAGPTRGRAGGAVLGPG
jgi:hypothetical protein